MQKLTHYIKGADLTLREFARREGISASFLSELTTENDARRKSPSLAMALKLQTATHGAVKVSDWPKLAEVAAAIHANKRGHAAVSSQGDSPKEGAA